MRILVVEDEPAIARRIERLTREILGERLESLSICARLADAERAAEQSPVDVVLLDLNLGGRDGFELLKRTASSSFHTIVISAYAERALEAFEYGVLDFVPKPFNRERLERAYRRLLERESRASCAARVLAVRKHAEIVVVPVADVVYLKGAGPYSELVLRDGRRELHSKSLEALLALLPEVFERTHKSYVVRTDEVVRLHLQEGSRYEVELRSGERLPVGRTRYQKLRARLGDG